MDQKIIEKLENLAHHEFWFEKEEIDYDFANDHFQSGFEYGKRVLARELLMELGLLFN